MGERSISKPVKAIHPLELCALGMARVRPHVLACCFRSLQVLRLIEGGDTYLFC
jgi:hypothetical protein